MRKQVLQKKEIPEHSKDSGTWEPHRQSGSRESEARFSEIWNRNANALFEKCLIWMSGRRDLAEEAFSRAAIVAVQKYRSRSEELINESGWLARLTFNVCIDLHREQERHRQRFSGNLDSLEASAAAPSAADRQDPEESCLQNELQAYLQKIFSELPPRLRASARLHFESGLSHAVIAETLDISAVNVRKRLQEARAILRRRIRSYFKGDERLSALQYDATAPEPDASLPAGSASRGIPQPLVIRPLQVLLPSGLERDVDLFLTYRPQRASNARLGNLAAYIERHPTGWKKSLEYARLLRELGRLEESLARYRFVVGRQPRHLPAWLELAETLVALDRRAEASESYRRIPVPANSPGRAEHVAGRIALCEGRDTDAVTALEKAAELDPMSSAHRLALGRHFLETGRTLEALQAFNAVLAIHPGDTIALTLSHQALVATGQEREALRRVARAEQADPSNHLAVGLMVDGLTRARRVTGQEGRETRLLLQRLRRLAGEHAGTHRSAAFYHLARGDWQRARAVTAEFVERHPMHARGWLAHGNVLRAIGDPLAAGCALRALALDPSDREVHVQVCSFLPHEAEPGEVRTILADMLERFPGDWRILAGAAAAFARLGEGEQARLLSLRSVHTQPALPAAWLRHGEILIRLGMPEEAAGALEILWDLLPAEDGFFLAATAACLLAECHGRLRQPDRERAWYQTAAERCELLQEDDPALASALRGRARAGLGDRSGALAAYRAAIAAALHYPHRREVEAAIERLSRSHQS